MKRTFIIIAGAALLLLAGRLFLMRSEQSRASTATKNSAVVVSNDILKPKVQVRSRFHNFNETNFSPETDPISAKHLSPEQVAAFVEKSKRSAQSLVSAFEETHDTNYLHEAASRFPSNALVQLSLLTDDILHTNLNAVERQQWLDRLKASSPQNALPNYVAAIDAFREGQPEIALAEMNSAATKSAVDPFYRDRIQNQEEMYLLSGLTPLEAKETSTTSLLLPLEAQMKGLQSQMVDMQKAYVAAGDTASAENIAAMGVTMARQWQGQQAPTLITELVGLAMERMALNQLDPNKTYDFLGNTPAQRLDELNGEKQTFRLLGAEESTLYSQLNDGDKLAYLERAKVYGEVSALNWLHQTFGKTQ